MHGHRQLLLNYLLCFGIAFLFSRLSDIYFGRSISILATLLHGYLLTYIPVYFLYSKEGCRSDWFQKLSVWKTLVNYFPGRLNFESPLIPDQQYIFASFPHGHCSVNHVLTMTDGCGMLSKYHWGNRCDLCATVLFYIPIVREIVLLLGNVEAGGPTAIYNLNKGKSLLIFVGGEKEQLLTKAHEHKIFLRARKGFVKLAIQYGTPLVPMYCYGENDSYYSSDIFLSFRQYLQRNFALGIPVCWGVYGSLFPLQVPLTIEFGNPLHVNKISKEMIRQQDIDTLHEQFMVEMERLFERTKGTYNIPRETRLLIL